LLIEDDPRDAELAGLALEKFKMLNKLDRVEDGVEAIDYLTRKGRYASRPDRTPDVVILDLKLPRLDGMEVLKRMRNTPELKSVPFVAFTSSNLDADIQQAYDLGVNSYVVKPHNFKAYISALAEIGHIYGSLNEVPVNRCLVRPIIRHDPAPGDFAAPVVH
jgi:CheY-like chemotaxis protein